MKLWLFGLPVCCVIAAVGCGGGDDDTGATPGGKAGASAGQAGKGGGAGGKAGKGGGAGKGGSSAGASDNAGQSGAGGSGATGQAGEAGARGESGASAGGNSAGGEPAGGDSAGGQGGSSEVSIFAVEPASVSIAKTSEKTLCAVLDLGNSQVIHAGELHVTTSDVVFDLRVSAVSGTAAPVPVDCAGFSELTDTSLRPLLFTRQRSEDIVFPAGTAYTFAEHQLLRFEIHAYNESENALDALVHLNVVPVPDSSYEREAGLLILYDNDESVPPGGASLDESYFKLPGGFDAASIFRASADEHQFGTGVTLATASQSSGPFSDFYTATDNPPLPASVTPSAAVPASGGIKLACTWSNTSQQAPMSGLSHTDEQCAGYVYYAPAVDTGICIKDSGTVICCSDTGGNCTIP